MIVNGIREIIIFVIGIKLSKNIIMDKVINCGKFKI